jgi:hypothetical protein
MLGQSDAKYKLAFEANCDTFKERQTIKACQAITHGFLLVRHTL